MTIAILALQGAFAEHQQMLHQLGVESTLIRNLNDWQQYLSTHVGKGGLILPGGESTAMMKIMHDEGLLEPIRQAIVEGLPVLGTCAGMILLDNKHLDCMRISVLRNAYGRQLGSFQANHNFKGITEQNDLPMVFIRAPYIEQCGEGVEILSTLDNHIVAARQDNMLACSFHPELTNNTRVHKYFLEMCR